MKKISLALIIIIMLFAMTVFTGCNEKVTISETELINLNAKGESVSGIVKITVYSITQSGNDIQILSDKAVMYILCSDYFSYDARVKVLNKVHSGDTLLLTVSSTGNMLGIIDTAYVKDYKIVRNNNSSSTKYINPEVDYDASEDNDSAETDADYYEEDIYDTIDFLNKKVEAVVIYVDSNLDLKNDELTKEQRGLAISTENGYFFLDTAWWSYGELSNIYSNNKIKIGDTVIFTVAYIDDYNFEHVTDFEVLE